MQCIGRSAVKITWFLTSITCMKKGFLKNYRSITSKAFCLIEAKDLQLPHPVQLRGRKFLQDADKQSFPSFLQEPKEHFPLALQAQDNKSIEEWGRLCREEINEHLLKHGAVLFRRLPLSSIDDFFMLVKAMDLPQMNYDGGAGPRESLAPNVYSASDEPAEFCIELHNEISYLSNFNKKIFFFCQKPAEKGGETALCKNSDILKHLDERFVEKIRTKRIRYIRQHRDKSVSEYLSWQQVLNTDSREEAERKMEDMGFDWEWSSDNNVLKFWSTLDAFTRHHITGEEVWFNQAHSMHNSYFKAHPAFQNVDTDQCVFPTHAAYGDGEEFEPRYLEEIRAAGWKNAVGVLLKRGDLIVLDNMAVQHARLSFKGDRKMALALLN